MLTYKVAYGYIMKYLVILIDNHIIYDQREKYI